MHTVCRLGILKSGKAILFSVAVLYAILLGACANLPNAANSKNLVAIAPAFAAASGGSWWKPTADQRLSWYWQLQEAVNTSFDVDIYDIDIDTPQFVIEKLKARGVKLICYFSVGTVEQFRSDALHFPSHVIGESYPGYEDERWLDLSNYQSFAHVMRARLDRCASKGFDGVEGDNVDAFNQYIADDNGMIRKGTSFGITQQQSIEYVRWLAAESHRRGLAFGLKNAESIAGEVVDQVDWMMTENCVADNWCAEASLFIERNKPVLMAEYVEYLSDLSLVCMQATRLGFSAIYRNTELGAPGVYEVCR